MKTQAESPLINQRAGKRTTGRHTMNEERVLDAEISLTRNSLVIKVVVAFTPLSPKEQEIYNPASESAEKPEVDKTESRIIAQAHVNSTEQEVEKEIGKCLDRLSFTDAELIEIDARDRN